MCVCLETSVSTISPFENRDCYCPTCENTRVYTLKWLRIAFSLENIENPCAVGVALDRSVVPGFENPIVLGGIQPLEKLIVFE